MCAVDLNADGLSDLLVGAPMATGVAREEGRVHVYINQGQVGHALGFTLSALRAAKYGTMNSL